MKKRFSTELAYILGLIVLAFGTALMARANLGMSMVVAPAYLIYLKVSSFWPGFTFGMAEYCFQAFLLLVLCIAGKRFKWKYLFSFVTALLYGNLLDRMMKLVSLIPADALPARAVIFAAGTLVCAAGVSLLFHTYLTPEAYELFVKEIVEKTKMDIYKVKTIYDCCSCLLAIAMSFLFVGFLKFEGVKLGTVVCAVVNGWVIGKISLFFEKHFEFQDFLPLRKYFD